MNSNQILKLISFNCKGLKRSTECIKSLCQSGDVIALQETWLMPYDLPMLGQIHSDFMFTGKSSIDLTAGLLKGRPYGGVAILWRKNIFTSVDVVQCNSDRISGIKCVTNNREMLFFCVYMPTDSVENMLIFNECLSEIVAISESYGTESVYILGDFNAHPSELFGKELMNFCDDQKWVCADLAKLGRDSDTHTFISDAHGCRRWLDHCLVTEAAWLSISDVKVRYDVYWSDHFPLEINCNLYATRIKTVNYKTSSMNNKDKIKWGEKIRVNVYREECNKLMKIIDFPRELRVCCDKICTDESHRCVIDVLYQKVILALQNAAIESSQPGGVARGKRVVGWNKHVKNAHRDAREKYRSWKRSGMPLYGKVYLDMKDSKKEFKNKLKYCQRNKEQLQMDRLAEQHSKKNFIKFWKETNKMNPKTGLPVSVDGEMDAGCIASIFKEHFRVRSTLISSRPAPEGGVSDTEASLSFSAKEVKATIKRLARGRAPGHDGLSIEHLVNAGSHVYRILAMLYTFCMRHCYLPSDLMETVIVPVVKNKTGDISDKANYRPISLAAILGKVFDGLLESKLSGYLKLNDAQFGFRNNLSTESAILTLKQTVKYYTERKTPIYGAFLDLTKAFDLVCYEKLWAKLKDLMVPAELVNILRFWYKSQTNRVKWAGAYSEAYRLECGVRQGGLTSPALFNIYINQLIDELRKTEIGCSIDGTIINNISYADDMVLLSPSISALRRLLSICESYAATHGLVYNVNKSELLVFKSKGESLNEIPPVFLNGVPLKRVSEFKYLGHIIREDLSDVRDIDRERRALAVRCNMLARRFARCNKQVKLTLFKAYCQTFYTCSMWVTYTQRAYNDLRVQYNNGFRMLMGLPRFCSASQMFAEAHTDDFYGIMRKRAASVMGRMRGSSNGILRTLVNKPDNPFMKHWVGMHMHSQCFIDGRYCAN